MIVDVYLLYQFLRRLTTPFEEWDAFKLGIIDKDGEVQKKRRTLKTREEKKAWGYFDILAANLKKLLGKLPGGDKRIATFAAALMLLRESERPEEERDMILEDQISLDQMLYWTINEIEEEIANVGINSAGLGQGPDGEPGRKKKQDKLLRRWKQAASKKA